MPIGGLENSLTVAFGTKGTRICALVQLDFVTLNVESVCNGECIILAQQLLLDGRNGPWHRELGGLSF